MGKIGKVTETEQDNKLVAKTWLQDGHSKVVITTCSHNKMVISSYITF